MKPEIVNREPLFKKETLENIVKVGTVGLVASSLGIFSRYILPEITDYHKVINGETKAVLEHYLVGVGLPAVINTQVLIHLTLTNNPEEERYAGDIEKVRKRTAEMLSILGTIGVETLWESCQMIGGEPITRSIYQLTGDFIGVTTYTYFLARETGKEMLSATKSFLKNKILSKIKEDI